MAEDRTRTRDIFLMDVENEILRTGWDNSKKEFPKGTRRYEGPEWGAMMREACANHSDVTFEEYCAWCRNGGGDEWSNEENFYDTYEEEFPDELLCELQTFERHLELYTTRLQYLRDRDDRLALVREGRTDLYEHYEEHFDGKIREFEANIAAIKRRLSAA